MLTNETILNILNTEFKDVIIKSEELGDLFTITIKPQNNYHVIAFLKIHKDLNFFFLTDLCGLHLPDQSGEELGVVYHLHNLIANKRIRVKTFFSEQNPKIESITNLFESANWQERETFDFYGIKFTGHPDLRRILNVDEMEYFPMRKEIPLEDSTRTDKDDRFFGRISQQTI